MHQYVATRRWRAVAVTEWESVEAMPVLTVSQAIQNVPQQWYTLEGNPWDQCVQLLSPHYL